MIYLQNKYGTPIQINSGFATMSHFVRKWPVFLQMNCPDDAVSPQSTENTKSCLPLLVFPLSDT